MNDNTYEQSFTLILHAGDAKCLAEDALEMLDNNRFDEALEILKNAESELKKAHSMQAKLIQNEANGEIEEVSLIMVHAQDHVCMATTTIGYVKQIIKLHKKIYELERRN